MFNTTVRDCAVVKRNAHAPLSDAAQSYIAKSEQQPNVLASIQVKWQEIDKNKKKLKLLSSSIRLARKTAFDFMYPGKARDRALRPSIYTRFVLPKRRRLMGRLHRHFFRSFDDVTLATMKYIYFPMHKETDIPLNFQAAEWHDQRNTVGALVSCLPAGHSLLVREHRVNYGQRPTRYYRELSRLPNVILVDAFDSQFKYIQNAELVVTENGSSGWEGLLLSRRVLTLAPTFYDGAGLAGRAEEAELAAAILDLLSSTAVSDPIVHKRALGCMVDAEFETVFPLQPGDEGGLQRLAATLVPGLAGRAESEFGSVSSASTPPQALSRKRVENRIRSDAWSPDERGGSLG